MDGTTGQEANFGAGDVLAKGNLHRFGGCVWAKIGRPEGAGIFGGACLGYRAGNGEGRRVVMAFTGPISMLPKI